jgi:pimeloyl-ACP methyl ester carboxylesterase
MKYRKSTPLWSAVRRWMSLQSYKTFTSGTIVLLLSVAGSNLNAAGNPKECHELTYSDIGQGHVIVFSHGFLMDRTMFDPQISAFSERFRLVTVDNRARASCSQGPYDLYDIVEDYRILLDRLGVNKFIFTGMSMGGYVAIRFALRYPERVEALVLIDSSADADPPQRKAEIRSAFEELRGLDTLPPDFIDWVATQMFSENTLHEKPELVSSWKRRWERYTGDNVYWDGMSFVDREDLSQEIGEIDVPVLLLHGEYDSAVNLDRVVPMLDVLPNATLEIIEFAGHTANLEQPEAVNKVMSEFLERIYPK